MSIEYRFLDCVPGELIATSELPVEDGIAVAVRTTGYEAGKDEIVQLSIVDFGGDVLFERTVKPQNVDVWTDEMASGGIKPSDVQDCPELYQFEDEVAELFEGASIVVGQHVQFIHEAIETSWITLHDARELDLIARFCSSHCTLDYPGQPAAVASLQGIAAYYGLPCDESSTAGIARTVAACYLKLVEEAAVERLSKAPAYWDEYERDRAEARRNDVRLQEAERIASLKTARINALLWLCAAAVFSNLAVQLHIRGVDFGFVAVSAAAAVYFVIRCIMSLYAVHKLRHR